MALVLVLVGIVIGQPVGPPSPRASYGESRQVTWAIQP